MFFINVLDFHGLLHSIYILETSSQVIKKENRILISNALNL